MFLTIKVNYRKLLIVEVALHIYAPLVCVASSEPGLLYKNICKPTSDENR
ncbi:hypothetical protein KBT16_15040 [Nostoc sp. CCCryo 231-06]|nr:hypothetical protein [Nostoc sp. CCCryo 231-06]